VSKVRRVYIEGGVDTVLNRKKPDRIYEHRLDGENEAHLIALVWQRNSVWRDRWTLRLLRDRLIQLGYVENISPETIRTTLKKTNLSLG